MSTLVINKTSLSVKLESTHLLLHDNATNEKRRVPLVDVERVIVVGQPAITFPVLAKLMDLKIPCSFMTGSGRWRGVMDGDGGFHAERRVLQYERLRNAEWVCALTRGLVVAKISNSRRTLQRFATERGMDLNEITAWRQLKALSVEAAFASSLDFLRGIEGMAANHYFRILSDFFPEDTPFPNRTRRPPKDPANALLSFCYVLLTNVVVGLIRAHGLDVSCGFFHRGGDRSPALALDLMEPFRPVLVDRLVVGLLSHRRVRASDHFEGLDENGVVLSESGRRIVFTAFDEVMGRSIKVDERHFTNRQIIEQEVCRFIKALEDGTEVEFYKAG